LLRAGEDGLDGFGPLLAGQRAHLADELVAHGFLTEEGTGDGDDQQQYRRQREHHV